MPSQERIEGMNYIELPHFTYKKIDVGHEVNWNLDDHRFQFADIENPRWLSMIEEAFMDWCAKNMDYETFNQAPMMYFSPKLFHHLERLMASSQDFQASRRENPHGFRFGRVTILRSDEPRVWL